MNFAAIERLPLILVLELNGYAYSTPSAAQFAGSTRSSARAPTESHGESVDGNDVEAVFEATRQARERALAGEGPTLIAATTMRMHGHGAHDDARYVPAELLAEWEERDPLERQRDASASRWASTSKRSSSRDRRRRGGGAGRRSRCRRRTPPARLTGSSATASRCRSGPARRRGAAFAGLMERPTSRRSPTVCACALRDDERVSSCSARTSARSAGRSR